MSEYLWWKNGVVYQIYPRSFQDSNDDGIGDLQGIIQRLDYLKDLGIDAIWISPIFASPMVDFGYDVADYTAIHPMFGDMETFDRLLDEAHTRELKVILDYVPNHSSDQHAWFKESRSSRDNPKRDWYIWKNAKPDGSPPNNWESIFGGPAWTWDEATGQYYLHSFLKEQPDLNWRNPELVAAMENVLRFWLDKGVDGFRMDAVMCSVKHADFPDNPPVADDSPLKPFGFNLEPKYSQSQPELHNILHSWRKLFDSYPGDRVMIGETWVFDMDVLASYYGKNLDEFHLPYNFMATMLPWDANALRDLIQRYYAAIPAGGTPNFVFGNHDVHRPATRHGYRNHRSIGLLLLTLWGVPTMYYGDELGMEDGEIPVEFIQDPWGKDDPDLNLGRDPERTPMQWDDSANAGFTAGGVTPWLPVASNYKTLNAAAQIRDERSTLNFYRKLLQLRKTSPALHGGSFEFVDGLPDDIIAYLRENGDEKLLCLVNFSNQEYAVNISHVAAAGSLLISTDLSDPGEVDMNLFTVVANQGYVIKV